MIGCFLQTLNRIQSRSTLGIGGFGKRLPVVFKRASLTPSLCVLRSRPRRCFRPSLTLSSLSLHQLECSYDDSRPDHLLYGHLCPRHILAELSTLHSILASTSPSPPTLKGLKVNIIHVKETLESVGDGQGGIQARIWKQLEEGKETFEGGVLKDVHFHLVKRGEILGSSSLTLLIALFGEADKSDLFLRLRILTDQPNAAAWSLKPRSLPSPRRPHQTRPSRSRLICTTPHTHVVALRREPMELVPSLSQNSINPSPRLSHSSCPPSSSRLFSSISLCIPAIQDRFSLHKLQSRLERRLSVHCRRRASRKQEDGSKRTPFGKGRSGRPLQNRSQQETDRTGSLPLTALPRSLGWRASSDLG